jgi:hypothetical protein
MHTKTPKKMTLNLDVLKVQSMVMPANSPIRAVTTSQTCPTRCDTHEVCSNEYCTAHSYDYCPETYEWGC